MENMVNDGGSHWDKSSLSGELGWGVALLVTAGGALLGLVRTREHVCRLCLEAGGGYLYPSAFSMGWNFLDTNEHFAKSLSTPCLGWVTLIICLEIAHLASLGDDRLVVVLCCPEFSL